jgi:response regulator RpfG family c-di-GMP phosphodiesterase
MPRHQQTVLLVDDHEDNLAFLARTFHGVYRTIQARTGEAAIEVLKKEPIDVIITDQRMPGLSGTDLLEQSLRIKPSIVRIIISGYTDSTDMLSAINVCRVNHYLVKPVNAARLLDVVATALGLVPDAPGNREGQP